VPFHTLHRRIDAHHLRLMTMLQKWKGDVETVATDNGLFTLTRTVRVTCLDGFLYCLEHKRLDTLVQWAAKGVDLSPVTHPVMWCRIPAQGVGPRASVPETAARLRYWTYPYLTRKAS